MAVEEDLAKTRCVFTLHHIVSQRVLDAQMKNVKDHLEDEVRDLEMDVDLDIDNTEEMIQSLDLLTVLEFKLGSPDKAMEFNDKAMQLTGGNREFTLGNRAHLLWLSGDSLAAQDILDQLANLRHSRSRETCIKAQQGYCFFRLGGPINVREAIDLYEKAIMHSPERMIWLLQLGRAYRRASHPNMSREEDAMHQRKLRLESYNKRAAELFDLVTSSRANRRIKAIAFSERAYMESTKRKDRNVREIKSFCHLAQRQSDTHPLALVLCGKSLMYVDTPWARQLLEKATVTCRSSNAFTALGRCLKLVAADRYQRSDGRMLRKQIEENLKEAVRISPIDVPAKVELAKFFQDTDRIPDALGLYSQIIDSYGYDTHFFSLATAYERKAMCLLELCKNSKFVSTAKASFMRDAEQLCIKTLTITFKLFTTSEIQGFINRTTAVKVLKAIAGSKENREASSRISRLMDLVENPTLQFQVFSTLVKAIDNDDRNTLESTLEEYLRLGRYEAAYTLLEVSIVLHGHGAVDDDLALKVAINVIRTRLESVHRDVSLVFPQVFKRHSYTHTQRGDAEASLSTAASSGGDSYNTYLDVLIVYDEAHSEIICTCLQLERAIRDLFGLAVSTNLKHTMAAGLQHTLQLKEIKKAKVVLLLIGRHSVKDSYFDTLLECLCGLMDQGDNPQPPNISIIRTEESARVPTSLSKYPQMSIGPFIESFSCFEKQAAQSSTTDDEGTSFTGSDEQLSSIDTIISFFCFLSGIEWPAPL